MMFTKKRMQAMMVDADIVRKKKGGFLIKRIERILTPNGCFQYQVKYEKMLENILGSKNHVRSRWVPTECRHYFM